MFSSMAMRQPPSLTSYDSAPGSLLTGLADSVISGAAGTGGSVNYSVNGSNRGGQESHIGRLFIGNSQSVVDASSSSASAAAGATENQMARHDSSPSGFFSHLLLDHGESSTISPCSSTIRASKFTIGIVLSTTSTSREGTPISSSTLMPCKGATVSREPQLRLSGNSGFSRIQENGNMSDKADREHAGPSNYMGNGFTISSWDDHSDSINFATSPGKRSKGIDVDLLSAYTDMDSQASAELGQYEKFFQLQQDQVPFKVRAKRGCATHPRSIAERERRTRISDKLRKLQEVVPNMEKQTSTSDMLDLAVQHIKDLQTQLKVMSQERDSCRCQNKR